MAIATQKYIRKPLYVDAVRVSARNFEEMAAWCQGEIKMDDNAKRYIKVRVQNPKNPRQTKAMVGDWILYTETGYKVYTNKAFLSSFDLVEAMTPDPPVEDGDVTVLGRECFVSLDESVISFKGVNYYPSREAGEEDRRLALEEAYRLEREKGSPTLLEEDAHEKNVRQQAADIRAAVGPDVELVEATPETIAQAVLDNEAARQAEGPTPTQSDTAPPARDNGHRVISLAEQREMDPDEIKGLIQAGAVLAQEIV